MDQLPFVDSHLHFWDRARFRYDWLEEAGSSLPFRFGPDDVEPAEAVVFVQADCAPDQGVAEAAWAAGLVRERSPHGAVVAFAPAEDRVALPGWIDRLRELPAVAGIRRLLQDEPDDLLTSPELADGVRRIGAAGLAFDACVRHGQLPALLALRRAAPECEIVLDHLGKPPVRDGWGSEAAERWHSSLLELAGEPRTTVKLSGLAPEAAPGPLMLQVTPFLQAGIDAFGPDRCMIGSDFPVSAATPDAPSYRGWFDAVASLVDGADRDALLRGTALRVYRTED